MEWPYIHLVTNHFPIVLGLTGAAAAVVGALVRTDGAWRFAALLVLLAGLASPFAYISGTRAEETMEEEWYVEEQHIEHHEEAGLVAFISLLVAGLGAGVSLWKPDPRTRTAFVILALAAAGLTARAALEGGEIVHESPVLQGAPPGGLEPASEGSEGG